MLFAVVTFFCVWIAWQTHRAYLQRSAVERVLELGGEVEYSHELADVSRMQRTPNLDPPGPAWLRSLVGEHFFLRVVRVGLTGHQVHDDDLKHIGILHDLRRLDLDRSSITDAGLMHLRNLTNLQMIDLDGTNVKGDGLRALRGNKQLEWIILDNTPIDDAALQHLSAFPALETVRLRNVQLVSDEGLMHLHDLSACVVLDLCGTPINAR